MNRIVIIGASGTGKTTLAFNMAARLRVAHHELDDLFWRPNWQMAPDEEFRTAVTKATESSDRWVMSGNYGRVRDILWNKADTLVWLDYSFGRSLAQLLTRTAMRVFDRKPVCNGNIETLSNVFSSQGIIPWFLKTFYPRRHEYSAIFNDAAAYPHLQKIRLHNPKETAEFLKRLEPAPAPLTT